MSYQHLVVLYAALMFRLRAWSANIQPDHCVVRQYHSRCTTRMLVGLARSKLLVPVFPVVVLRPLHLLAPPVLRQAAATGFNSESSERLLRLICMPVILFIRPSCLAVVYDPSSDRP